jgi:hypothetical protein
MPTYKTLEHLEAGSKKKEGIGARLTRQSSLYFSIKQKKVVGEIR